MFADLSDFDIFEARGNAHLVWVPVPRGRTNKLDEKKAFFLMPNIQSAPRHFIRTCIDLAISLPVNVLNPAGISNEMESEELSGDPSADLVHRSRATAGAGIMSWRQGRAVDAMIVAEGSHESSSPNVGKLSSEKVIICIRLLLG